MDKRKIAARLVRLAKSLVSGFSSDSNDWYDVVVEDSDLKDSTIETLYRVVKLSPTRMNFNKFVSTLKRVRSPWKNEVQKFVDAMQEGKYNKEFRKFEGSHSQISELFNLMKQAFEYKK